MSTKNIMAEKPCAVRILKANRDCLFFKKSLLIVFFYYLKESSFLYACTPHIFQPKPSAADLFASLNHNASIEAKNKVGSNQMTEKKGPKDVLSDQQK